MKEYRRSRKPNLHGDSYRAVTGMRRQREKAGWLESARASSRLNGRYFATLDGQRRAELHERRNADMARTRRRRQQVAKSAKVRAAGGELS